MTLAKGWINENKTYSIYLFIYYFFTCSIFPNLNQLEFWNESQSWREQYQSNERS